MSGTYTEADVQSVCAQARRSADNGLYSVAESYYSAAQGMATTAPSSAWTAVAFTRRYLDRACGRITPAQEIPGSGASGSGGSATMPEPSFFGSLAADLWGGAKDVLGWSGDVAADPGAGNRSEPDVSSSDSDYWGWGWSSLYEWGRAGAEFVGGALTSDEAQQKVKDAASNAAEKVADGVGTGAKIGLLGIPGMIAGWFSGDGDIVEGAKRLSWGLLLAGGAAVGIVGLLYLRQIRGIAGGGD